MNHPKDNQAVSDFIMANDDILIETYGADPDKINHVSKVEKMVETFRVLKEHVEDLDAAILQTFAGCAFMIFKEGYHEKGAEAETLYFAARDRLATL